MKLAMQRSRLSRKIEKQSQKTLFLSILGIILILFVLIKFGVPVLINFAVLLSDSKQVSDESKSATFVSPPVLDTLFDATPSAKINITGKAGSKQTINLYINGELIDKTETKEDSFKFEDIELTKGVNTIMTKAITKDKKESDFSNEITVVYKKDPPLLEIESPTDGKSYSKDENTANIVGKTDPDNKVTVNDFWAIVDSDGKFTYSLSLKEGDNSIKIVATDTAGNKTEKEIKVKYSP